MLNKLTSKKEAWVHATLREIRVKVLCSRFIKRLLSAYLEVLQTKTQSLRNNGEIPQQVVIPFWMSDIKMGWPRRACRREGLTLHTSPFIAMKFCPDFLDIVWVFCCDLIYSECFGQWQKIHCNAIHKKTVTR